MVESQAEASEGFDSVSPILAAQGIFLVVRIYGGKISCWEPPWTDQVKMSRKYFHQHVEAPSDRQQNDGAWSDLNPVSMIMEELLRTRRGDSRESLEGF